MQRNLIRLVVFCFFCGVMALPSAAALDLAQNGRPRATIVTGEKPSIVVQEMAKELAKYLEEMTGAKFRITPRKQVGWVGIRLAVDKTGKMERDSYTIQEAKRVKELVITGANDRGLVFGVYGFLERQGCRFWAPDQETIPKKKKLILPSKYSVSDKPAYTYRNATWSAPGLKSVYFTRKVGLNVMSKTTPELGADAKEDYNHSIGWKHRFLNADKYIQEKFDYRLDWYAMRLIEPGIAPKVEVVAEGEGKTPESRLAEPYHSQYDKGKGGELIRTRIHVCPTSPGAAHQLIQEVRAWLKAHPEMESVSVSAADNPMICQCARCGAMIKKCGGQYSAVYLHLANKVAYAIKDEFPGVTVRMLAYWTTIDPPTNFKEKIAPNLDICLAFGMYRGPHKPNLEDKYPLSVFNGWKKYAPIFIWGYYAHFANFLYPYDDIFNMGADLRAYYERGVRKMYVQLKLGDLSDLADLRCWLFGKLTWNPYQDEDALIKEWVDGTCGKGAPFINQYLDLRRKAKAAYQKKKEKGDWKDWDGEVAFKAYQLLQQAREAAKDEPAAVARIEKQSAGLLPLIIRPKVYAQFVKAARAAKVEPPTKLQLVDHLESLFVKYKVNYVGENLYGYKIYIDQLKKEIENDEKNQNKNQNK